MKGIPVAGFLYCLGRGISPCCRYSTGASAPNEIKANSLHSAVVDLTRRWLEIGRVLR